MKTGLSNRRPADAAAVMPCVAILPSPNPSMSAMPRSRFPVRSP